MKHAKDKGIQYGLVGGSLSHSFSKAIHEELADYTYDLISIPEKADFIEFISGRQFKALNITIPYKETVIPLLDTIDARAAAVGAVNTVVNKGGRLHGYNTDYAGFEYTMDVAGIDVSGKKTLVLGAGGAAKAISAVLRDRGAGAVILTGTHARDGVITNEKAVLEHGDAEIIINTTPVGMYPDIDGVPVSLDDFPSCMAVVDIIYNPLRTSLMLEAADRGIKTAGGLDMLVMQAVKAAELFTGRDIGAVAATVGKILQSKVNIVLIGMPSSGKSTIGMFLEKATGKRVIDTDAMVVEADGRSIREMWDAEGEEYFRRLEHEAVRKVSAMNGCIIATGGGVIKNKANMKLLRHNGHLVFLDRPLEMLVAIDEKRPLCCGADAVSKLYYERYDLYKGNADLHVDNSGSPQDVMNKILNKVWGIL